MQDIITSIKNEKLRNVALLQKKKKAREEQGLFVTEGTRIFEDALKSAAEYIEQIFISESFSKSPEWKKLTESPGWKRLTESPGWNRVTNSTDRTGLTKSAKRIGFTKNAERTELTKSADRTGLTKSAERTGSYKKDDRNEPAGRNENCAIKAETGIFTVADDIFEKICETVTPQGILCVMRKKKYRFEDLSLDRLLLLENIQDPGNLGTMIRTAEAAGITGVIMSSDTVEIYSPKVTRSTMGSIFRVPFLYSDDICDIIDRLKDSNVTVYGAYLGNGRPFNAIQYRQPCAVLIGNEGNGISDRAIERVSERVFIPMCGETESLNAAVAAALIMYRWI